MKLKESLIKNYTDSLTYKWGLEYYNQGLVEDFVVNIEFNDQSKVNTYYIDTWVKSISSSNIYNVQVSFNDISGFTSFYCDCVSFHKGYRKKGICKHIIAALIKYFREKQQETITEKNVMKSEKLVEEIKSGLLYDNEEKIPLKLDIKYFFNSSSSIRSSIEIKVGVDKTYVVKDAEEFLEVIDKGGKMEFGKGFTLDTTMHRFIGEDRHVIEFLQEIREIDKIIYKSAEYFPKKNRLIAGKKVFVIESHLKRSLRYIEGKEFDCNIDGKTYKNVVCKEEKLPLEFSIYKSGEYIVFDHNHHIPKALDDKREMFFFNEKIYIIPESQSRCYIPLYNALMEEKGDIVKLSIKEIDKIISCIIPCLKSISKNIILDEYLIELTNNNAT